MCKKRRLLYWYKFIKVGCSNRPSYAVYVQRLLVQVICGMNGKNKEVACNPEFIFSCRLDGDEVRSLILCIISTQRDYKLACRFCVNQIATY